MNTIEKEKYYNELIAMGVELSTITSPYQQFQEHFTRINAWIEKIYIAGHEKGLKEAKKQRSSVIIKKLTDEN